MTGEAELDPASVEIGQFYPHSPDRVWRALTEPSLLEEWLMPSTGLAEARVGSQFVFTVPTEPPGEIACKILALRPGRLLALRWVDLRAEAPGRWILDWTVSAQGHGARLLLTHSGFDTAVPRQKMARNGMERMWKRALTQLGKVLDAHPI